MSMQFLRQSRTGVAQFTSLSRSFFRFQQFCQNYATGAKHINSGKDVSINQIPMSKIRNVGIIAHIDAGKTTTTERMLYYSGSIRLIGEVDQGDTITDYLPAERDRGITIQSAAVTLPWNQHKINVIDTPGHADFTFEVIRSLRVLDGAVTILDGVAGVEAQTEKVWKQAKAQKLPSVIFINKMDRMGSGYSRTCKEIISKLKTKIVLANIPYFIELPESRELVFSGIVDIVNKKLLIWDPSKAQDDPKINVIDLESEEAQAKYPEYYQELLNARESAIETLCEFDDQLVDEFLENEEDYMKMSANSIRRSLRSATINNYVSPVLCGASFKNIGVQPLLDAVVDYLPNPNEMRMPEIATKHSGLSASKKRRNKTVKADKTGSEQVIATVPSKIDKAAGLVINNNHQLSLGLAFKVITDYRKAPMIFARVYSGRIQNGSAILNTRTGKKFRVTNLFLINGNDTHTIDKLTCGNIGVMTVSLVSSASEASGEQSENGTSTNSFDTGSNALHLNDLNEIKTGDTFIAHAVKKDGIKAFKDLETGISLNPIVVPPSIFITSLEPKTLSDKRILDENLKILLREDPSLRVFENEEGQTLLSGMGELHLEIVKDRLINDLKTNCDISKVMVTYKETLLRGTGTMTKSVDGASASDTDETFEVQFEIEPFDGPAEEHHLFEEVEDTKDEHNLFVLPNENNLAYVPYSAAPKEVQYYIEQNKGTETRKNQVSNDAVIWPLQVKYEQVTNALVSSCISTLQNGGQIASLPISSALIKFTKWNIPKSSSDIKTLLYVTRDAINEALRSLNSERDFTILEPIMDIKVFTNDEDIGKVSHDLTSTRKAEIISIDDEVAVEEESLSDQGLTLYDFAREAEKQYLPHDVTLNKNSSFDNNGITANETGNKVIHAHAPLREMIGYLSKLRSLTKGRGTFLMEYHGLNKVTRDRLDSIKQDI